MLVLDDVLRLHNFPVADPAPVPPDEDGAVVLRRDEDHLAVAPDGGQRAAHRRRGPADRHAGRGLLLGGPGHGLQDVGLGVGGLVNAADVSLEVVRPRKCLSAVLEFKCSFKKLSTKPKQCYSSR